MNEKNLIPFSERTESEQREIRSRGGKASGESRRRTASLKKAAKEYFRANPDTLYAIIEALAARAENTGDPKAVDKILDLLGETVQREELAFRKKQQAKSEKPDNGKMAELIAGLQEVFPEDDLYEEAAEADEALGETEASETESS